jgi:hypothetical protein
VDALSLALLAANAPEEIATDITAAGRNVFIGGIFVVEV